MAEQMERSHAVAALILLGLMLAAIAAGIGGTWINDADGTCGALYRPNLSRIGCARKLMPAGVATGVLIGGALLAWDAARRTTHTPSRRATICVAISLVLVFALMTARAGMDGGGADGHSPGGAPAPTSAPSARSPLSSPGITPLTAPPR